MYRQAITRSLFVQSTSRAVTPRCVRAYSAQLPDGDAVQKPSRPSIMPEGTVMRNLSVLKDEHDPIALPDAEYPAWIWSLSDKALAQQKAGASVAEMQNEPFYIGDASEITEKNKNGPVPFDFKKERRELRAANRAEIRAKNFLHSK